MRFDADFLRTLDQLRFVSSRAFAGSGRGERKGRQRGRGLEFADYRPYAQGDDFRHIDWKAYKRLNRLLLRLYDEEQDLRIYLFIDASGSMARHGKFEHAVRIAGALCYIGFTHLDRVSLLPFADRLGADLSAGYGRATIARIFESLEALQAAGPTNLWRSIGDFTMRPRRAGLAIVISDFLDPQGCEASLKLLAARGHEVVAVHVVAGADRLDGASLGEVEFIDDETGERRLIDITPGLLRAHARAWESLDTAIAAASARSQGQYLRADVDVPFERTVLHAFRAGHVLE